MARNSDNHLILEDLTIEILWRLPVKTLLRFKCVCKYWYRLTQNSTFITKHHRHKRNNGRLLIKHYNYTTEKFAFALFIDEVLANVPLVYHDLYYPHIPSNPSIVGPYNGILCLWDWEHIALWNPATREFRYLPLPLPHLPLSHSAYCYFFGLGLVPVTNDYKLVWIRYFWDVETDIPYLPSVVAVYTLCTDSWRVFDVGLASNRSIYNTLCNTYVNGFYYWRTSDDYHQYMMLSFDMKNEVFKEIPAPPDIPKAQWGDVGMYNDSIAMFLYEPNATEKHIDIWVMKEVGCWTKQFTMGPFLDVDGPLGMWKNDELFLETSTSNLLFYNPITQEISDLGPRGKDYCLKAFMYKESLVSVKAGNECRDGDKSFKIV